MKSVIQIGSRWQFVQSGSPPEIFEVVDVCPSLDTVMLQKGGRTFPGYEVQTLLNTYYWKRVTDKGDCPRCEKRDVMSPDYLCHACRFGV